MAEVQTSVEKVTLPDYVYEGNECSVDGCGGILRLAAGGG